MLMATLVITLITDNDELQSDWSIESPVLQRAGRFHIDMYTFCFFLISKSYLGKATAMLILFTDVPLDFTFFFIPAVMAG